MVYALALALLLVCSGDTKAGRASVHDYLGERGRSLYFMEPATVEE